jgi:hypothetical protein
VPSGPRKVLAPVFACLSRSTQGIEPRKSVENMKHRRIKRHNAFAQPRKRLPEASPAPMDSGVGSLASLARVEFPDRPMAAGSLGAGLKGAPVWQ